MAADIPAKIGRYDVLGLVGEGGMGTVYKALQPSLNRVVAIKTLPKMLAADPELTARFQRETEALARLNHPNIVNIIDCGSDGDVPYFAMEFVDGCSLDQLLATRRLSLSDGLRVIHQVGKGLDYAHGMGVIHRDLKLSNILVTHNLDVVKIADFGISRIESGARHQQRLTTTHAGLGTMYYMAPEQAAAAATVDRRADIYSLGVVCYQLLTGQIPAGRFSLPSQLNSHLPPEIDPIVLRCLAFNRDERYPTVADVLIDLDRVKELAGFRLLDSLKALSQSTTHAMKTSASRLAHQQPVQVGTIALLSLAALGTGGYFLLRQPAPAIATTHAAPTPPTSQPAAPARKAEAPPAAPPPVSPRATPPEAAPAPVRTPSVTTRMPATPPTTAPAAGAPAAGRARQPAASPTPSSPAQNELDLMRAKIDAGSSAEVLGDLQRFVLDQKNAPLGLEGSLLLGELNERLGRLPRAIDAYREGVDLHASDPRAGSALYKMAQAQAKAKRTTDAVASFRRVIAEYAESPWAMAAMLAKADVEDKQDLKERDATLGAVVPSALVTYRTFVTTYPNRPEAEGALWRLGNLYEDTNRPADAAAALMTLASRFPATRLDAAFKAGELYEKKLHDPAKALAAYNAVPASSPNARKARDRVTKLSK